MRTKVRDGCFTRISNVCTMYTHTYLLIFFKKFWYCGHIPIVTPEFSGKSIRGFEFIYLFIFFSANASIRD